MRCCWVLWELSWQGGAVEPPEEKAESASEEMGRSAGLIIGGLWAAVLASCAGGQSARFQPPVSVTSIREGRSPGGVGLGGASFGKPVEPGRDSRVARTTGPGTGAGT